MTSNEGARRRQLHGVRWSQIAAREVLGREKVNEKLWIRCSTCVSVSVYI